VNVTGVRRTFRKALTRVENVAQWAVIKYHDLAEVRLNLSKILDVRAVAECAMLPIIATHKVFPLDLQPVDDRIGILLHRRSKNDEVVPFTNLATALVRR
jgi:hypothetical protein